MVRHVKRKKYPDKYLEDADDWDVQGDLDRAWWVFSMVTAFEGKHMPVPGGFFDQYEEDMTNLFTLQWRESIIEAHLKANEQQQAND